MKANPDEQARELEKLAAELHEVYWQQSITQRDMKGLIPRHPRDYNALSEEIKDYDRALARYILQREAKARLAEAAALHKEVAGGTTLDEIAWLIERAGLCLGFCEYKFAWVTFTNEDALRFARQRDAYSFLETMKWEPKGKFLEGATVTEHIWCASPAGRAEPPTGAGLREALLSIIDACDSHSGADKLTIFNIANRALAATDAPKETKP